MLQDQISQDYVAAMKAKNSLKSATLNLLRAQIKNVVIEKRVEKLEDAEVLTVIKKQVKQRQDSIAQFEQGGRQDLVDKEKAEMVILMGYLPASLPDAEIERMIKDSIAEAGATSVKDMGAVMKLVMGKVAGRADSRHISDMVKNALAGL